MNQKQLSKDFAKIIATMRRVFGDFRFIEEQRILRQFINRDDPFEPRFLSEFIDCFAQAVDYTVAIEDARLIELVLRLLMDYIGQNLISKEEQELCEQIKQMPIPRIALRYAQAEKNYIKLQIAKYLSRGDQKVFYKQNPHLKPKRAKKNAVDTNLDDANEARYNLQNNIVGLRVLIQKEIIATWEEFTALETEYCEANSLYYHKSACSFVPPVMHKLSRLLNAFQLREAEHQNSSHSQLNCAPNIRHFANARASSDDNGLGFTFELDNPLLAQSSDDEGESESESNMFEIIQDGQLELDFESELAAFESENELQQRLAVVGLQGAVLQFLEKITQLLAQGLPASYQNAVLHMIKLLSSLVNYTYYYSYTRSGNGLISQLMHLERGHFYQDLQMLIQQLNQELILSDKLELWQKLFMPVQRGYICTEFSIISNCIAALDDIARANEEQTSAAHHSEETPGIADNPNCGESFQNEATNTMKIALWRGLPINALESPINLNQESISIFYDAAEEPVYRPYFTRETVNALVITVQVLTQQLIQYTLETRLQTIQLVFPDQALFDEAAHALRGFRFSDEFLRVSRQFECESFGFLQIERQFERSNQQSIARQRSSPSRSPSRLAPECSSLSTNSIVHNTLLARAEPRSSLKNSYSEFEHFSLVNQPHLEDFTPLSYIARGGFGCVILVNYARTNARMIMKIMRKSDIIRKNQVDRIRMEREILQNIEEQDLNPRLRDFVVKFYGSFRSSYYLFLLLEYMQFGNLSQLLSACGAFSEEIARQYVAELALALSLMHQQGIIYNDLKPENLLISAHGHLKFTDFGLSNMVISQIQPSKIDEQLAQIEEAYSAAEGSEPSKEQFCDEDAVVQPREKEKDQREQEHRVVGTPNYLAPELLLNKSPTPASDFWSLGVCMYEFLYGCKPFHGQTPQEIFQAELEREPEYYPEVSEDAIDLMKCLLRKNPEERLSSVAELKKHRFFAGFEFFDILARQGPYVPTVKYEGQETMIHVASENWIDEIIRESGLVEDCGTDLIGTQSDDRFSGYSFYKDRAS